MEKAELIAELRVAYSAIHTAGLLTALAARAARRGENTMPEGDIHWHYRNWVADYQSPSTDRVPRFLGFLLDTVQDTQGWQDDVKVLVNAMARGRANPPPDGPRLGEQWVNIEAVLARIGSYTRYVAPMGVDDEADAAYAAALDRVANLTLVAAEHARRSDLSDHVALITKARNEAYLAAPFDEGSDAANAAYFRVAREHDETCEVNVVVCQARDSIARIKHLMAGVAGHGDVDSISRSACSVLDAVDKLESVAYDAEHTAKIYTNWDKMQDARILQGAIRAANSSIPQAKAATRDAVPLILALAMREEEAIRAELVTYEDMHPIAPENATLQVWRDHQRAVLAEMESPEAVAMRAANVAAEEVAKQELQAAWDAYHVIHARIEPAARTARIAMSGHPDRGALPVYRGSQDSEEDTAYLDSLDASRTAYDLASAAQARHDAISSANYAEWERLDNLRHKVARWTS
jgi:hypothetical protein